MDYTRSEEKAIREWWNAIEAACYRHEPLGIQPRDVLNAAKWGTEPVVRTRGSLTGTVLDALEGRELREWWSCSIGHMLAFALVRRLARSMDRFDHSERNRLIGLTIQANAAELTALDRATKGE